MERVCNLSGFYSVYFCLSFYEKVVYSFSSDADKRDEGYFVCTFLKGSTVIASTNSSISVDGESVTFNSYEVGSMF